MKEVTPVIDEAVVTDLVHRHKGDTDLEISCA